jgi:hypothetical protein
MEKKSETFGESVEREVEGNQEKMMWDEKESEFWYLKREEEIEFWFLKLSQQSIETT